MTKKFFICLAVLTLGVNVPVSTIKKMQKISKNKVFSKRQRQRKINCVKRFLKENKGLCFLLVAEVALLSTVASWIYFSKEDKKRPSPTPTSTLPPLLSPTQTPPAHPQRDNVGKVKRVRFAEKLNATQDDLNEDKKTPANKKSWFKRLWGGLVSDQSAENKDVVTQVGLIETSFYAAPFATTQHNNLYCGIYSAAAALASQKKLFTEARGVSITSNYTFQMLCDANYESLIRAFERYKITAHEKLRREFEERVKGSGPSHDHCISKWPLDQTKVAKVAEVFSLFETAKKENKVLELCLSDVAPENIKQAARQTYLPLVWGSYEMPHEKDLADFFKINKIEISCLSECLLNIIVEEATSRATLDTIFKKFVTIETSSSHLYGSYKIVTDSSALDSSLTDEQKVKDLSRKGIEATTISSIFDRGVSDLIKRELQRLLVTGIGTFILRIAGGAHFVCLDIDKDRPVVNGVDLRVIYRDSLNPETSLPNCPESKTLIANLITLLDAKFPRS